MSTPISDELLLSCACLAALCVGCCTRNSKIQSVALFCLGLIACAPSQKRQQITTSWEIGKACLPAKGCPKYLREIVPNFQTTEELYGKVKHIGSGGQNVVFLADNRVVRIDFSQSAQNFTRSSSTPALEAAARLTALEGVSMLFPEVHGAYFAPLNPRFARSLTSFPPQHDFLHMEMELVTHWFMTSPVTDALMFEVCLGEWAARELASITIHDGKLRHFGMVNVSYHRVYEIGNDRYAFPPGLTAKQVDLDVISVHEKQLDSPYVCRPDLQFHQDVSSQMRAFFKQHGDIPVQDFFRWWWIFQLNWNIRHAIVEYPPLNGGFSRVYPTYALKSHQKIFKNQPCRLANRGASNGKDHFSQKTS